MEGGHNKSPAPLKPHRNPESAVLVQRGKPILATVVGRFVRQWDDDPHCHAIQQLFYQHESPSPNHTSLTPGFLNLSNKILYISLWLSRGGSEVPGGCPDTSLAIRLLVAQPRSSRSKAPWPARRLRHVLTRRVDL